MSGSEFLYVPEKVFICHLYAGYFVLNSGSYYSLAGSLVLSLGLLHDVVCKVCFQTKCGDANKRPVKAWPVVCLLIYFKYLCGNSRQFFEEVHIEELQDQELEA